MNTHHALSVREPACRWIAVVAGVLMALGPVWGPRAVAADQPEPGDGAESEPGVVRRFEGGARAAVQPDAPIVPAGVSVLPLSAPDPGEALRAFNLVRGWLNDWQMGDQSAPPVAAACVTLRLDGRVVGRAEALGTEATAGRGVIEQAVAAAMAQAEVRVPVSRDVLWEDRMREAGRAMRLTLELGGLPVPVEVASFEQAAVLVSPGLTGVGARVGTGAGARTALMFPSALVGAGMDAGAALASVAGEALGESDAALAGAPALAARGVRFLAFESVWVAEQGQDRTGVILQRGGRVFETRDVSTPMLRELGGRLADLLALPESAGGSGAGSMEAALGAYALVRWSGTPGAGGDEQRAAWGLRAHEVFADAGASLEGATPARAALWAMVGGALGPAPVGFAREGEVAVARGRAGEALGRALAQAEGLSPPVAAMVAWAGAARGGALGDPEVVDKAEAALRGAYTRTPAGEWVGLMPWAGWAEHEIAGARRRLAGSDGALGGGAALRDMRDLVWRHQIGASDVGGGDRDFVGGIVFTRGRQALPTWHSLRPLAYVATMLGDARLTPENEFPGQVLRMLSSLRFLRQLCADGAVMTWADGRAWGVRAATWTDEQPEEATALGLLVITETLRSLEAVSQRRAARAGAGPE